MVSSVSNGGPSSASDKKTNTLRRVKKGRPGRSFSIFNRTFRMSQTNIVDALLDCVQTCFEYAVFLLGPVLIMVALGITYILAYTFFAIMLPMMWEKHQGSPQLRNVIVTIHCTWVVFLLVNILFNYFMCVTTRNSGKVFDKVVRELAFVTDFLYPETPAQTESWRREYEDKMVLRLRRRREREAEQSRKEQQASEEEDGPLDDVPLNNNSPVDDTDPLKKSTMTQRKAQKSSDNGDGAKKTAKKKVSSTPIRRWMMMGPYEWGYCNNSQQAKPPRSHYDHVTKRLVLNLDHYCPWMFNAVGYFNYRYFVNFLIFIFLGMNYGAALTYESFSLATSPEYRKFRVQEYRAHERLDRPTYMMPHRDEKMLVQLSFMLCAAVGLAILCLGGFHIYLVLTAQTTIEFHGNWSQRQKLGKKWKNPYDEGWRKNWKRVYGDMPPLLAMLPSTREPGYLPVPVPGKPCKRIVLQQALSEVDEEAPKTPLLPGNSKS